MYWHCCPRCGNIFGLESGANGTGYYPKCDSYFTKNTVNSNASIAVTESNITIHTKADNANKTFYYPTENYSKINLLKENKLDINAKSITINENKMSITIDKDNIDKFDVIEINGVRFVKEDN